MITNQQYQRLMSEYKKTGKIIVSAMKADVDPQTARKYIEAGKRPAELQAKHTWRTRPDPLAKIWDEVAADAAGGSGVGGQDALRVFSGSPGQRVGGKSSAHLLPAGAALAGDARSGAGGVLCPGAPARAVAAIGLDLRQGVAGDDSGRRTGSPLLPLRAAVFGLGVGDAGVSRSPS